MQNLEVQPSAFDRGLGAKLQQAFAFNPASERLAAAELLQSIVQSSRTWISPGW